MIQRAWESSRGQVMRKLGEGMTRTSGRKLKLKSKCIASTTRPDGTKEPWEDCEGGHEDLERTSPLWKEQLEPSPLPSITLTPLT